MEPQPKMSSIPKPARKSLEPSPAAWTRNLPQTYSTQWCFWGTAPEAAAIELAAVIRIFMYRSGSKKGGSGGL